MSTQSSFVPDNPDTGRPKRHTKKHKPVSLWARGPFCRGWFRWGRYETHEIAEAVRAKQVEKLSRWEFRIGEKPE